MKKLFLIALILISIKNFAQVTKSDFETFFTQFKLEKMENIYIKTSKVLSADGTTKFNATKMSITVKDNAIYFYTYEDPKKNINSSIIVIPFTSINSFWGNVSYITLNLVD